MDKTHFVVAENPSDDSLVRIPVRLFDGRISLGSLAYLAAEFCGEDDLGTKYGAYGGLSGAPVYDDDGALVGAVSDSFWPGGDAALPAVRIVRELREGLQRGRVLGTTPGDDWQPVTSRAKLEPGRSVGIVYLWGDLIKGTFGTVTISDGREVLALAHGWARNNRGPRIYALMRSTLLGITPTGAGTFQVYPQPGPIVGVCTYDGEYGVYCNLDVLPPTLDLEVVSRASPLSSPPNRIYHMAKDPYWLAGAFREALYDALLAYSSLHRHKRSGRIAHLEVSLTPDHEEIEPIMLQVPLSRDFVDTVVNEVLASIAEVLPSLTRVTVVVTSR